MPSRKSLGQEMVEIGSRKMAQAFMEGGAISIIAAFNMTDSPERPWRYPKDTHVRVARLLQEIQGLFDRGGFEESRAPIAQADGDFQRFMVRAAEGKA